MSPEQLLGQVDADSRVVVADFEAGLGTVLRLADPVDVVVVVVEPTVTSLDVGQRAVEAVLSRSLGQVVVTANRVRDADDLARVRAAFPDRHPLVVPDEPAILAAERAGRAPLDTAPTATGVQALVGLLDQCLAPPPGPARDPVRPAQRPGRATDG